MQQLPKRSHIAHQLLPSQESHLSSQQVPIYLHSHSSMIARRHLLSENWATISSVVSTNPRFQLLHLSTGWLSVVDLKLVFTATTEHFLQQLSLAFLKSF
jgi:hypothetical protein